MTTLNFSSSSSFGFDAFNTIYLLDQLPSLNEEYTNLPSLASLVSEPSMMPQHDPLAKNTSHKNMPARKSSNTTYQVGQSKTSKRSRRLIPEIKEYIPSHEQPTQFDVVSGRGGRANHHAGNRPYWTKILDSRRIYRSSDDNQVKAAIARAIVEYIQNSSGRFLQRDNNAKRWFVLPETVALHKVKQALRDKYVPLWARKMNLKVEGASKKYVPGINKKITKPSKRKEDDLTQAIGALPSFQTNREQPLAFSVAHSLNPFSPGNSIPSLNEKSLDVLLQKRLLSLGSLDRSIGLNKTGDDLLDAFQMQPGTTQTTKTGGTDWYAMYEDGLSSVRPAQVMRYEQV
jgi:hypothetical protein